MRASLTSTENYLLSSKAGRYFCLSRKMTPKGKSKQNNYKQDFTKQKTWDNFFPKQQRFFFYSSESESIEFDWTLLLHKNKWEVKKLGLCGTDSYKRSHFVWKQVFECFRGSSVLNQFWTYSKLWQMAIEKYHPNSEHGAASSKQQTAIVINQQQHQSSNSFEESERNCKCAIIPWI